MFFTLNRSFFGKNKDTGQLLSGLISKYHLLKPLIYLCICSICKEIKHRNDDIILYVIISSKILIH